LTSPEQSAVLGYYYSDESYKFLLLLFVAGVCSDYFLKWDAVLAADGRRLGEFSICRFDFASFYYYFSLSFWVTNYDSWFCEDCSIDLFVLFEDKPFEIEGYCGNFES